MKRLPTLEAARRLLLSSNHQNLNQAGAVGAFFSWHKQRGLHLLSCWWIFDFCLPIYIKHGTSALKHHYYLGEDFFYFSQASNKQIYDGWLDWYWCNEISCRQSSIHIPSFVFQSHNPTPRGFLHFSYEGVGWSAGHRIDAVDALDIWLNATGNQSVGSLIHFFVGLYYVIFWATWTATQNAGWEFPQMVV